MMRNPGRHSLLAAKGGLDYRLLRVRLDQSLVFTSVTKIQVMLYQPGRHNQLRPLTEEAPFRRRSALIRRAAAASV